MSKLFYDHIVDLQKVEKQIKKVARTTEEKEELYHLIDEIVHHKVLSCILDRLPANHHQDFLTAVTKRPHDESLIDFVQERVVEDVGEFIRYEINMIVREILEIVEEKTNTKKK